MATSSFNRAARLKMHQACRSCPPTLHAKIARFAAVIVTKRGYAIQHMIRFVCHAALDRRSNIYISVCGPESDVDLPAVNAEKESSAKLQPYSRHCLWRSANKPTSLCHRQAKHKRAISRFPSRRACINQSSAKCVLCSTCPLGKISQCTAESDTECKEIQPLRVMSRLTMSTPSTPASLKYSNQILILPSPSPTSCRRS
jgi:hypothetical protein